MRVSGSESGVTQVPSDPEASKTLSAFGFSVGLAEQRMELMEALATVETSRTPVSASRRELVQAIKGKCRNVPTSIASFMSRKREDVALESRP